MVNSSVDNNLVDAIEALNDHARRTFPEFIDDRDLINALIGKFIYIYVLIDRKILSIDWLASHLPPRFRKDGLSFLHAILGAGQNGEQWTAHAAFSVFDIVDDAINGSVFTLTSRATARVPDALCQLIHRVVRRGEVLFRDGSQLGFFDVSFNVLRTETISAIYERFVSIENYPAQERRRCFLYATPSRRPCARSGRGGQPNHKAFAPDRSSRWLRNLSGRVAPARLMERHPPMGSWPPPPHQPSKSLLAADNSRHRKASTGCQRLPVQSVPDATRLRRTSSNREAHQSSGRRSSCPTSLRTSTRRMPSRPSSRPPDTLISSEIHRGQ